MALHSLEIRGFRSINDQTLELNPLNVFIGGNGSGKSNLIGVFQFLSRLTRQELALYTGQSGGANSILHFGRSRTEKLFVKMVFSERLNKNIYEFTLQPTDNDGFFFESEATYFWDTSQYSAPYRAGSWSGNSEAQVTTSNHGVSKYVKRHLDSYRIYHFHDTSSSAPPKQTSDVEDNRFLHSDASNLAAFLYWLQEKKPDYYQNIEDTVRQIAPFFRGFKLAPTLLNPEKIRLEWEERGSDTHFSASSLSG
jgi:predicted ATPase